jgi:hypothetical protein
MIGWCIGGILFLIVTGILTLALCKSAGDADDKMEKLFEEMINEKANDEAK